MAQKCSPTFAKYAYNQKLTYWIMVAIELYIQRLWASNKIRFLWVPEFSCELYSRGAPMRGLAPTIQLKGKQLS
jgi:hypothetical protein